MLIGVFLVLYLCTIYDEQEERKIRIFYIPLYNPHVYFYIFLSSMFNHECLSTTVVTKAITWAWVFVTSVYFIGSFAYPYLDQKNLTAAYANGRAAGQQETYNAAMQTFSGNTFQNGQKVGSTETITQLVNMLGKQIDGGCKEAIPVPLPNGTGSV